MYSCIKIYLGKVKDTEIFIVSNNQSHLDIIRDVFKKNDIPVLEFKCSDDDVNDTSSSIKLKCILPNENKFGIGEYNVFININLFEIMISGFQYGFYDRLIGSIKEHYVKQNHFSDGFIQATENYKSIYDTGKFKYWGTGLIQLG